MFNVSRAACVFWQLDVIPNGLTIFGISVLLCRPKYHRGELSRTPILEAATRSTAGANVF